METRETQREPHEETRNQCDCERERRLADRILNSSSSCCRCPAASEICKAPLRALLHHHGNAASDCAEHVERDGDGECEEGSIIAMPNACAEPRTVMIETQHAIVAYGTMARAWRSVMKTCFAPLVAHRGIILNARFPHRAHSSSLPDAREGVKWRPRGWGSCNQCMMCTREGISGKKNVCI